MTFFMHEAVARAPLRLRVVAVALIALGTSSCLYVAYRMHRLHSESQARVEAMLPAGTADADLAALRQAITDEEAAQLGRVVFGFAVGYGVLFLLLGRRRSESLPILLWAAPPAMLLVLGLGDAITPLAARGLVAGLGSFTAAGVLLLVAQRRDRD